MHLGKELTQSLCKMVTLCPSITNDCQSSIWDNQSMKRKCWLFCMQCISSIIVYWDTDSKLKLITVASSIFWNKESPPQSSKNRWPSCLGMSMRSFTRREKKMQLLMLFQGNMKMKGPSFPCLSLYPIGFKQFSRNGCKIQKFIAWSNNRNKILKIL